MSPNRVPLRAPSQPAIAGNYQYEALTGGPAPQRFWHGGKLEVLRRVMPLQGVGVVLDLGCGSGNLTVAVSGRCRLPIGLDPSLEAASFCRSRPDAIACEFAMALGHRLPLARDSVDAALLVEVIEHLPEPKGVLSELHRVIKPGGPLFVTTPNYGLGSPWPVFEWLADRSRLVASMAEEQHVQAFSRETLRSELEAARFEVLALGSFYRWSPIWSLVSIGKAYEALARELASGVENGALLYAVAMTRAAPTAAPSVPPRTSPPPAP